MFLSIKDRMFLLLLTLILVIGISVTVNADTAFQIFQGGTGRSSNTAYMPIAGGTTTLSPQQSIATGLAGQSLRYVDATTLPDFSAVNLAGTNDVTGLLPIANGGTNANNAATARANLGAGTGDGDVVGPSSSTDDALVTFDTTTGKLIQSPSLWKILSDNLFYDSGSYSAQLFREGGLQLYPVSAFASILDGKQYGDSGAYRFRVTAEGGLSWADGTASADVFVDRVAPNFLGMPDNDGIIFGDNATRSDDPVIVVSRDITGSSGDAHAFSDSSIINRSGTIGYNSFDGRVLFTGSNTYNHYTSLQAAPEFGTAGTPFSGTITNVSGMSTIPIMYGGTIENYSSLWCLQPDLNSGADIENLRAIYIPNWGSQGSVSNNSILSENLDPSSFAGPIQVGIGSNSSSDTAVIQAATYPLPISIESNGSDDFLGHVAVRTSATAGIGGYFTALRAKGTPGSETVLSSGDQVLNLAAFGFDGTDYATLAAITMNVDSTPGSNDMPGNITFLTSTDGGQTATERMKIANDGVITVQTPGNISKSVLNTDATQTLTNKRITPRVNTITNSATPSINTDTTDYFTITAMTSAITSMTTNLSGTPTNGQIFRISITSASGLGLTITWGTGWESSATETLPTLINAGARIDLEFWFNSVSGDWRLVNQT